MNSFARRARRVAALCFLAVCVLFAQDNTAWKSASSLPGVDFSKLTAAQKATTLKLLRQHDCPCGCGMKLAECRIADPNCAYSNGLAAAITDAIRQGKSESDALAAAKASRWASVQPVKVLDDPVSIPIAGAPYLGPANAPLTLIEFSDFQCPYCVAAIPEIKAILRAYPTQVKLVYKQFPLEIHSQAALAAAAAVAAHKQGKFWAMHDAMYADHDNLSRENILALAKQNGLDMKRFEADLDSTEVHETVIRDEQDGNRAGVEGTPTIFLNGQRYNGPIALASMKPLLEAELKHAPVNQTASVKH